MCWVTHAVNQREDGGDDLYSEGNFDGDPAVAEEMVWWNSMWMWAMTRQWGAKLCSHWEDLFFSNSSWIPQQNLSYDPPFIAIAHVIPPVLSK